MSHLGWPPVRVRNYADEVQACLHLEGSLAQLGEFLRDHSNWHDTKHRYEPNDASADFCKTLTRLCGMMTDMRTELDRTRDYAKAAAGLEAVVGEGNVSAALAFSPLDAVDEYRPQDSINLKVIGHEDTQDEEAA